MKTRASGALLSLALLVGCTDGGAPTVATPTSASASGSVSVSTSKTPAARVQEHSATLEATGFSGVVEVRRNGRVLLSEAYGAAERSTGAPNTTRTRFRVASLTKQFTAVAILVLEQRGKLATTDPVCAHLPSCPPSWQPITIHDLLVHTSGVPDYLDLDEEEWGEIVADGPSHLGLTQRLQPAALESEPGKYSRYSNTGYVVLGAVIEALAGVDYGTFLRSAVLDPLGMAETTTSWPDTAPADRALGYLDDTRIAHSRHPREYADTALVTTASDLGRWNDFMLTKTPPLVPPQVHQRIRRPWAEAPDEGDMFGYGVVLHGSGDDTIIEHTGSYPGYISYNGIHPIASTSVTVLSNLETQDVLTIGRTLLDLATT